MSKRRTPVSVNIRIRRRDGQRISRQDATRVFNTFVDTQRIDPEYTIHAIDWEKGGKEYHYTGDDTNEALQIAFRMIEKGTKLRIDAPDKFS